MMAAMQQESFDNEKDLYRKGEDVGTRTNVVAADDLHFSKESSRHELHARAGQGKLLEGSSG